MKLRAIGLALAVTWVVAASGPLLAQYGTAPPGAPLMPPGAPMMPPGAPMMPPGGSMMPPGGAMMMPGGALPPPCGPMMSPDGAMMGGYPGMPPVMPYPGSMNGYGGCQTCGGYEPCAFQEGCCEGCPEFGRGGGCGCDGEGGCEPDGTPHSRARLEAVLLKVSLPEVPAVLSTDAASERLMGINALGFDHEFNSRLALEGRLPNDDSLELVFLGFQRWSDSASLLDPGGALLSPYQTLNGSNVVPYDGAVQHDISYVSRLWTLEANYWVPTLHWGRFQSSVMAGARFLRISEDFTYSAVSRAGGGAFGTTNVNAENNMPALQLGVMCSAELARHVNFRFEGKGGVGYNIAQQTTDILVTTTGGGGDVNYTENAGSQFGAFLADLSGVLTWQVNCYVGVHVGYQALWLDELVLAPENFNATFPTNGFRPILIEDNGKRVYHGALAGLEITW